MGALYKKKVNRRIEVRRKHIVSCFGRKGFVPAAYLCLLVW